MLLPVPHYYQNAPNAPRRNDCGDACVAMIATAYSGQKIEPQRVSADDGLIGKGVFTNSNDLKRMASRYGVTLQTQVWRSVDDVRAMIESGRPVIALVDYRVISTVHGPKDYTYGHWLVVTGYDDDTVTVNDPLLTKGAAPLPVNVFAKAFETPARGNSVSGIMLAPTEALQIMAGMGWNIAATNQDLNDRWDDLKRLLAANPPASIVVQNDLNRAIELRNLLPRTQIIYRIVTDASPDDNAQDKGGKPEQWQDPAEWLNRHIPEGSYLAAAQAGLWLYINNEPRDDKKTFTWLLQVARIVVQRGWKAVLGNWSLGMPHERVWETKPYAQALLQFVHQHNTRLQIGLHEYSPGHMAFEVAPGEWDVQRWPAKYPASDTYVIGRFRWLVHYARDRGWFIPVNITEWGTDRVPHLNIGGPLTWAREMWAARGIHDWQPFWYRQLQWAWNALYKQYPEVRGVAYFCYGGKSSEVWTHFDAQYYETFTALASAGDFSVQPRRQEQPPVTNPIITPGTYTFKRVIGLNVRVNASANAAKVGELKQGGVFTVHPDAPVTADTYTWRRVTVGAATGWAAVSLLSPSEYEAYTAPEQPPADERILNALYLLRGIRDNITALATAVDTAISDLEAVVGANAEPLAFVVATIEVDDNIEAITRIVPPLPGEDDDSESDNDDKVAA